MSNAVEEIIRIVTSTVQIQYQRRNNGQLINIELIYIFIN